MSPRTLSIFAVLLSSGLTAAALQHQYHAQETEVAKLRAKIARTKFHVYQSLHTQALAKQPNTSAIKELAQTTLPEQVAPLGYHNEGLSTPQAALQTFVWACDLGDTETVARMLFLSETERQRAEAFFESLPDKLRTRWSSLHEMAATLLIMKSMARSFPSSEVLKASPPETIAEDRVSFKVPYPVSFQQTSEGWKFVLGAQELETLERELSTRFGTQAGG